MKRSGGKDSTSSISIGIVFMFSMLWTSSLLEEMRVESSCSDFVEVMASFSGF